MHNTIWPRYLRLCVLKTGQKKATKNYWVENEELLSAPDLLSAEVHLRKPIQLTRSQFQQAMTEQAGHVPGITNLSYADYLKDSVQAHPEVVLRFTDAGKTKFEQVTRQHIGRQLAIIVDGQIISAPVIRQAIPGGVAVVAPFTEDEARKIVDKIYGKK